MNLGDAARTIFVMLRNIAITFLFALGLGASCNRECESGTEGCSCDAGECDLGLQCVTQETASECGGMSYSEFAACLESHSICEECTAGTEACPCTDDGLCLDGLMCASGVCVDIGQPGEGTGADPMGTGSE